MGHSLQKYLDSGILRNPNDIQELNDEQYIYVYMDVFHEKCNIGFVVNKNDPKLIVQSWRILSGDDKYCVLLGPLA